jgi:hypothetical protein
MQTTGLGKTGGSPANRFLCPALLPGACPILAPSQQAKDAVVVYAWRYFEQYGALDLDTGVFTRFGSPGDMSGNSARHPKNHVSSAAPLPLQRSHHVGVRSSARFNHSINFGSQRRHLDV